MQLKVQQTLIAVSFFGTSSSMNSGFSGVGEAALYRGFGTFTRSYKYQRWHARRFDLLAGESLPLVVVLFGPQGPLAINNRISPHTLVLYPRSCHLKNQDGGSSGTSIFVSFCSQEETLAVHSTRLEETFVQISIRKIHVTSP